jgi:hypothetical protein
VGVAVLPQLVAHLLELDLELLEGRGVLERHLLYLEFLQLMLAVVVALLLTEQ